MCRWLAGAKGSKIEAFFPAVALWKDAPPTMKGKMRIHVGDLTWEKGSWVSKWISGRMLELEYGAHTKSRGGSRWSKANENDIEKAGATAECPIRLQVMLEEDGKKLTLWAAGLPCKYGDASTEFPGFVGEAPRYPSVVLTKVSGKDRESGRGWDGSKADDNNVAD